MAYLRSRLSLERPFWVYTGLFGMTDLLLEVTDSSNTAITGSPFDCSATAQLGVYQSESFQFPTVGTYYLKFYTPPGSALPLANPIFYEVHAHLNPASDFSLNIPKYVTYATSSTLASPNLVILDYTGTQITGSPFTLSAISGKPAYRTQSQLSITTVGSYAFIWRDGTTVLAVENVQVLQELERASVYLRFISDDLAQTPLSGVTVLVSTSGGIPLVQSVTNSSGLSYFQLDPASYVVTLQKSGIVYDINNMTFTVRDPWEDGSTNGFGWYVGSFTPTFTPAPLFNSSSLSTLTVNLASLDGNPLSGATILISSRFTPSYKVGAGGSKIGVFGDQLQIKTDANGHAETPLLRGLEVEVVVEDTSVRRVLTVPDQATFDLADYFSTQDPFDIIVVPNNDAVRRSI